jgi:hypothetical protein
VNSARRKRLGELIYPDPQPLDTFEQFARDAHDDIGGLTLERLDDERLLARLRRALSPQPSEWLRERIARLEAEAGRRRSQAQRAGR